MKIIICFLVAVGVQSEVEIMDIDDIEYSEFVASQPLRYIRRVLICTNEDAASQIKAHRLHMFDMFPKMEIEFHHVRNCPDEIESDRHGAKSILAILAPKPFGNISHSEVPVYFYDAPYFLEDEAFSNKVSAVIDWRPLKHAFTQFFEQQDLIRIAIVSDDSPYSAAFEEELVGHFNEQGLVYNVQRCVEALEYEYEYDCSFHEALSFIKKNEALIVVANVDEKNALALAKQARSHGVTRTHGFVWLTRDWPFGNLAVSDLQHLGPVISLSLAPLVHKDISSQIWNPSMKCGDSLPGDKTLGGPHLASILQGLYLIRNAERQTKRTRIDHFYRDIANHMNEAIKSDTYDTQAFIRQINASSDDSSKVITIVVANSGSITCYTNINDFGPKVYDVKDCNIMRSNVFMDPCNDFWISSIVLVVLLFILLLCLIIYVYISHFDFFFDFINRKLNWSIF